MLYSAERGFCCQWTRLRLSSVSAAQIRCSRLWTFHRTLIDMKRKSNQRKPSINGRFAYNMHTKDGGVGRAAASICHDHSKRGRVDTSVCRWQLFTRWAYGSSSSSLLQRNRAWQAAAPVVLNVSAAQALAPDYWGCKSTTRLFPRVKAEPTERQN